MRKVATSTAAKEVGCLYALCADHAWNGPKPGFANGGREEKLALLSAGVSLSVAGIRHLSVALDTSRFFIVSGP